MALMSPGGGGGGAVGLIPPVETPGEAGAGRAWVEGEPGTAMAGCCLGEVAVQGRLLPRAAAMEAQELLVVVVLRKLIFVVEGAASPGNPEKLGAVLPAYSVVAEGEAPTC